MRTSLMEDLQEVRYYRKAQRQKLNWLYSLILCGVFFKLHFPEMKKCVVFQNIFRKIIGFIKWCKYQDKRHPKDLRQVEQRLPIEQPDFTNKEEDIKYTWIGHSTAVISIGEKARFLIDPVFSQRCSPFSFMGPKRYRRPACTIGQLPKINCVLVSHDHYDHLDTKSLKLLQKKFKPNFIAGLNSRDVFPKGSNLIQLDWTQSYQQNIDGEIYKITFVPVCHWGKRGLFDTNKRLWGGFVIQTPARKKIFYSGDTGYCQIFKELREIFGGFDLAILPIGAYLPRQILSPQHIDPSQAIKIHKQIRSKKSVGVHWGTFPLGSEHWCQPRQDLQRERFKQGVDVDQFVTVNHGGSFTIAS